MKFIVRLKGGSGSGNFGHEGIPGHVGGSASERGGGSEEGSGTFQVDEIVIMHSPNTGEDTKVNYRGRLDFLKSVVYDPRSGWQGTVPNDWLRKIEGSTISETVKNLIKSDMYSAKHSLKKKYPANSGDELTIKAAKTVSKKYKMRFQDILKLYTPSNSISGSRSWDKNGKIIIVR